MNKSKDSRSKHWNNAVKSEKSAEDLHADVPPNWYFKSIRENFLQRCWHKRRFVEVGKIVEPVDGKILDVGCADGIFTQVILKKSKAKKIVGIDVMKNSVDWANKHWKRNKKMKFVVADVHKLPFKAGSFDAVFALEVLEHIFKPAEVLKEIKRVMKKGGYGVFLVPSESILFKIVWFLWRFSGRMIWKDTHVQEFSNSSLVELCRKSGFIIERDEKFMLGMLHLIKVRKK